MPESKNSTWIKNVIRKNEVTPFLTDGNDFINDTEIEDLIKKSAKPKKEEIRRIIQKSLSIKRLEPEETAALLNVEDKELLKEIFDAAETIKKKVYDNRIVRIQENLILLLKTFLLKKQK